MSSLLLVQLTYYTFCIMSFPKLSNTCNIALTKVHVQMFVTVWV